MLTNDPDSLLKNIRQIKESMDKLEGRITTLERSSQPAPEQAGTSSLAGPWYLSSYVNHLGVEHVHLTNLRPASTTGPYSRRGDEKNGNDSEGDNNRRPMQNDTPSQQKANGAVRGRGVEEHGSRRTSHVGASSKRPRSPGSNNNGEDQQQIRDPDVLNEIDNEDDSDLPHGSKNPTAPRRAPMPATRSNSKSQGESRRESTPDVDTKNKNTSNAKNPRGRRNRELGGLIGSEGFNDKTARHAIRDAQHQGANGSNFGTRETRNSKVALSKASEQVQDQPKRRGSASGKEENIKVARVSGKQKPQGGSGRSLVRSNVANAVEQRQAIDDVLASGVRGSRSKPDFAALKLRDTLLQQRGDPARLDQNFDEDGQSLGEDGDAEEEDSATEPPKKPQVPRLTARGTRQTGTKKRKVSSAQGERKAVPPAKKGKVEPLGGEFVKVDEGEDSDMDDETGSDELGDIDD